ncbi:MAG: HlyD family efflux transporter periplasmic adaptor subunit [Pirellulales bacterium]
MKLNQTLLSIVLLVSCGAARAQTGPAVNPVIERCKVMLVDDNDIEIPASENGVLTYLGVKEGVQVTEGAEIAKIDDRQAIIARAAAKYGLRAANQRATVDVEVRHSKAAAAVAKANYEDYVEANSGKIENVVSQNEVRGAKLEWDRAELAIEKAQHDMSLAVMDYWTKKAELDAADLGLELRTVRSPFNGQVAEVYRHQNEWVTAGDPILRVIRLDTLYVDGVVYIDEYNPRDIQGCEVSVEVPAGRGEVVHVPGRIVYVNPELRYGERQQFVVRAEITNRSENGQWLVYPGQQATMTIRLGTATPAVSSRDK